MASTAVKVEHGTDRLGRFARVKGAKRKTYYKDKDDRAGAEARTKSAPKEHASIDFTDMDPKRMVMLFDQFNQESSERIVKELLSLEKESGDDINLFINSYGGEVNSLQAILDTMGNMKSKVNTVCLGMAASCGSALFAAGNKRYIGPRSKVLIHEVTAGAYGNVSQMEEKIDYIKQLEKALLDELSVKSGQILEFVRKLVENTDVILNSDESIEFGIADAVLLSKDLSDVENKIAMSASFTGTNGTEYTRLVGMVDKYVICKGDDSMDITDEDLAKLNQWASKYTELQASSALELKEVMLRVDDLSAKLVESNSKLVQAEQQLASTKMNVLLNSLIDEGKATQVTNTINKIAFEAVGYDNAVLMAATMPVIAKLTQESSPSAVIDDIKPLSRHQMIQLYMKQNNMEDTEENYMKADQKVR